MRRLAELKARLREHPERAHEELAAFARHWRFPLLDEDTALFFFYDGHPAEAVYLQHWVFGLPSRQRFRRLTGTNAFWLALDLPARARIEYKLEVVRDGKGMWTRDPLNPLQAFDPFGSNSVCQMPGYVEPPWTQRDPDLRSGRLDHLEVESAVFGGSRPVDVYLPAEYRPEKRYPVLICHDGRDYLRYAGIQHILDNLIGRHEVAPLIVAFTSGVARNEEYAANELQARHLVTELLPALEANYGVERDPAGRGLMGASFGAVSSLFTAWCFPGVFGQVMLQSGSFVFTDIGQHDRGRLWDPIVDFVAEFRQDPGRIRARLYMSCGIFESLIYYNRSLVPLLQGAGLDLRYEEAQDGHNWINWRDRLRSGLSWLFPGHLWMVYE